MAEPKVAVVFGGPSSEREVSCRSAGTLVAALLQSGLAVRPLDRLPDGRWWVGSWLQPGDPFDERLLLEGHRELNSAAEGVTALHGADVVFPVIHGPIGEDGCLQGLLRVLEMPFVGSDVLASSLAMDKVRSKALLAATTDLALPVSVAVTRAEYEAVGASAGALATGLRFPCIGKPIDSGSSIGLARLASATDVGPYLDELFGLPEVGGAMIEEEVIGVEVTCVVLGEPHRTLETLPPILIRPRQGRLFDYRAKYTPGEADEICPAPLPEKTLWRIRQQSSAAYTALGCRGLARVDFILQGEVLWFLEVNTMPGLTAESLLPKAARAAGYSLPTLFRRLVEEAAGSSTRGAREPQARGAAP